MNFDWLRRFWNQSLGPVLGSASTSGPPEDEHPLVYVQDILKMHQMAPAFSAGWWSQARQVPAHPGRVGGMITPKTIIVHTTDMMPDTFDPLVKAWSTTKTSGACAHFIIGRDGTQGVVQMVPITRNANHAGGTVHGWYKTGDGKLVHPNTLAVGIEIHGAGLLRSVGGRTKWQHRDSGRYLEPADVYVDARGRGWHRITDYQLATLTALLRALPKPEPSVTIKPDGDYARNGVDYYASSKSALVAGHVTLDPVNKTDPGPQVMEYLKGLGY